MLHGILKEDQVHDSICLVVLIQGLHRKGVIKPWVLLTESRAHNFARAAQLFAGTCDTRQRGIVRLGCIASA